MKRPIAVLVLRFSIFYPPRPVAHDELLSKLQGKFAAKGRGLPSEAMVKEELNFLVREQLLELEGVKYRITPAGAEAARELTPHNAITL